MTKAPVCVLGLGLIGGSVMRAATEAGREVFGYNRSIEGVQAAKADGFDATEKIEKALKRAAKTGALIVLAVPVPALPIVLGHVRDVAPDSPLTDVTSVKSCVLDEVKSFGLLANFVGGHPMAGTARSGWAAGNARMFVGAPWVISVDEHVDPAVWSMVMDLALDCGAVVVPAKSDEHDAAAAAISHLPHLLAEALAATAGEVPLAFALAAGSFRDGTRVAANRTRFGAGDVRSELRTAAARARPVDQTADKSAQVAGHTGIGGRPCRGRSRRTDALFRLQEVADRDDRRRTGRMA